MNVYLQVSTPCKLNIKMAAPVNFTDAADKSVSYKFYYLYIIQDNIIMELNDDDPSSKLLGVQIDIDLEDKGKSSEDMN